MFMGGCNQGHWRARDSDSISRANEFRSEVPVFLSSGLTDPIAAPEQHAAVRQCNVCAPASKIRVENCEGGHRLDNETARPRARLVPQTVTSKAPSKDAQAILQAPMTGLI